MSEKSRIYLSSPHLGTLEEAFVQEAFDTNWIAPLGPNVDAFEQEFCELVGCLHAAALSSGTAALHLALELLGVGEGDEVIVPSLTFVASANPVLYQGAKPVFVDSEETSWNLDADLVEAFLEERAAQDALPAAIVLVHLYGQCADLDRFVELSQRFEVPLIEDAAEALGSTYKDSSPGTYGAAGFFSFNGNKIITTSGGGMLVSDDADFIAHARKLATQARDDAPHYQHSEVGYNYRLSNICAGIGRGQLRVLPERVAQRRAVHEEYRAELGALPGVSFQPEAPWGTHTRWLTCVRIDPAEAGVDREMIRTTLIAENIEARPIWKPMHLQPLFEDCTMIGGDVCEAIFEDGLCLPSGSNMSENDMVRILEAFKGCFD